MLSTLFNLIVYKVVGALLMFLMSFFLSALDYFGQFILKPFDFTKDMFLAMFSSNIVNSIQNIMVAAGISVSVLLLVFGLLRVFTGKLNDDVPNPFALLGRFLFAIILNYWIITIMYDYAFPLAQTFFNKALTIDARATFKSSSINTIFSMFNSSGYTSVFSAVTAGISSWGISSTGVGWLIEVLFFVIFLIAATINVFKLVAENAERYFTVNVLVLSGPLASATIVSEKSSQIFKNWFQLLLSNILTIIFNLIGFKLILLSLNQCFATWASHSDSAAMIVSMVACIAVCRMAQKFDQLMAQVVFRLNPITNKSLLMGAAGLLTTATKSADAFGKMGQKFAGSKLGQKLGMTPKADSKVEALNKATGAMKELNNTLNGGSQGNENGAQANATRNGKDANNGSGANYPNLHNSSFKGSNGAEPDSSFSPSDATKDLMNNPLTDDNGKPFTGEYMSGANMVDASDVVQSMKGESGKITNEQAAAILGDVNARMDSTGSTITGVRTNADGGLAFEVHGSSSTPANFEPDTIASMVNGEPQTYSVPYSGSKTDVKNQFDSYASDNNVTFTHMSYDDATNAYTGYYTKSQEAKGYDFEKFATDRVTPNLKYKK